MSETPWIVDEDGDEFLDPFQVSKVHAPELAAAVETHLAEKPTATVELPAPVVEAAREYADRTDQSLDMAVINQIGIGVEVRPTEGEDA